MASGSGEAETVDVPVATQLIGLKSEWEQLTITKRDAETVVAISGLTGAPYSGVSYAVLPPTILVAQYLDTVKLGVPDAPSRLNGGNGCHWIENVSPGEDLERQSMVVDVSYKAGGSGDLVIYRLETEYRKVATKEVVATSWNVAIRRYPKTQAVMESSPPSEKGTSRAPVDSGPPATARKVVEVTPTARDLVRYAAATGDFYEAHYDYNFAVASGLPGVIIHGLLKLAWIARGVIEYVGPDSFVRDIEGSYRTMDLVGEPFSVYCEEDVSAVLADGSRLIRAYGVSSSGCTSTLASAVVERF